MPKESKSKGRLLSCRNAFGIHRSCPPDQFHYDLLSRDSRGPPRRHEPSWRVHARSTCGLKRETPWNRRDSNQPDMTYQGLSHETNMATSQRCILLSKTQYACWKSWCVRVSDMRVCPHTVWNLLVSWRSNRDKQGRGCQKTITTNWNERILV